MAEKVEILFTGLNKAKFKTGNSMMREIRKHVKESGKGNVSLVHGGRPKVSTIDRNVIKLGEITGLNVISNPLDFSHKNATGIRDQERIDNPNLVHYSYDSKGNLSLKDKYAGYWKNKYGKIGKETSGGKLRFPRSTIKDNKVIGKQTKETSKFKSLLDEIEDDTNPERQASGVTYAKNLDKWTKENLNINMITGKNQSRIDYLESGGVMSKDEEGLPRLIREQPSFKREVKSIDDFEQKTYVEDTGVTGREGDQRQDVGTRGGASLIRNKVTGKVIEKTKKYRVMGTILTEPTVVSVKRTGGMTDAEIARKNPYPQSSMSQLGSNQELDDYKGQGREVTRKVELKDNLKQLTDQTDITEKGYGEDKTKSGKGIERHTTSHLIKEQPIKDRVELKRTMKKFAPVFKRLAEAETKVKAGTNKPKKLQNLKRLDNVARNLAKQIPDKLAFDSAQPSDTSTPARSSTVQDSGLKNVPVPKATKVDKIKATKAKIAKGPLGGSKAKGTGWWEGTRRRVTPVGKETLQVQPQQVKLIGPDAKVKSETGGRFLSPIHKKINQRSQLRTKNPQEAKLKLQPITKTKAVTTDVTPNLKKVTSTTKPVQKTVSVKNKYETGIKSPRVVKRLNRIFNKKSTGTANIEDKHKKLKFTGKGIKFTRGLGAVSLGSTILSPIRGREEAKKFTGKKDPSFMDSMKMIYPFLGKPRKKHGLNPGDA